MPCMTEPSSSDGIERRDVLKGAALLAAGAGFVPRELLRDPAPQAARIGRGEIVMGLDGLSRVAEGEWDPFSDGHVAAAVIASAFFTRENELEAATQTSLLAFVEVRLLSRRIFAARPKEPADPELVAGLVKDLDAGIRTLRRGGHNIIFATMALKALRDVPEAVTPARVRGLRNMIQRFGTDETRGAAGKPFTELGDKQAFVKLLFEEYLCALELYLAGKGHHGFAGHMLTFGHALLELHRMGYPELAQKGVEAFEPFIQQARAGADLGGRSVASPQPNAPSPLQADYWNAQLRRTTDGIVSSHLVKYPYSFYALLKDLPEGEVRQRVLAKLAHLTAVS